MKNALCFAGVVDTIVQIAHGASILLSYASPIGLVAHTVLFRLQETPGMVLVV